MLSNSAMAGVLPKQIQEHLKMEQYPEARRALQSELISHPKNLEFRYHLAVLIQQADHDDQALQLYQENMTYGWHLPTVVNLVKLLQQTNKRDQAKLLLNKASKHFRAEAVPWYLLADMANEENQPNKADTLYRKALRADPLNGFARIRYARFLVEQQQAKKAIPHAKRANKLLPECVQCLTILGDVYFSANRMSEAITAYQKSLAVDPDINTRQQLVHALQKNGNTQLAKQMQQALDVWKKNQTH
ncbi:MAG: tetratricopeptide repeat protein [Mariprofundaceae bacterium]